MKPTMCCKSVWFFICFAYVTVQLVNAQESQENNVQDAMKLMDRLTETRKGLARLRQIINQMDNEPQKTQDLRDIASTRRGLEALKRILDDMENTVIVQQKKNCQFNLGGHCATESAAAVAHQWHFLNSPLSPGRKRRDTSLLKRLSARQAW